MYQYSGRHEKSMLEKYGWLSFGFMFGFIFLIVIAITTINWFNSKQLDTVTCKVTDLQQQTIVHGDKDHINTSIRYLVITDKETFICESDIFNGKYNNSDLFYHLKKDSTYTFKVSGYGKSFWFDYRNILEVSQ